MSDVGLILGAVEPWSKGHSGTRTCLSCKGLSDCKPLAGCTEARHLHRFEAKRSRNNEYRRQRRADARASGTVYRMGRGDSANKTAYARQKHLAVRELLFARLGTHACIECGFTDKRALHFDHVNGGGRQHRKSLPSGTAYYRALVNMAPETLRATFQVLCANCNAIKREEREEWRWRHAGEVAAQEDEGLQASA